MKVDAKPDALTFDTATTAVIVVDVPLAGHAARAAAGPVIDFGRTVI